MTRSTRTAGNPSRGGRRTPPPVRRSEPVHLSPQDLADAVWDLVDLVVRVSTAPQRGLAGKDVAERVHLKRVMRELGRFRNAIPGSVPGRKPRLLTPIQLALARLRRDINTLCREARRHPPTDRRDRALVEAVFAVCRTFPYLSVSATAVSEAVSKVRSQGRRRMAEEPGLAEDWLLALDERKDATHAAGMILAEVIRGYGSESLAAGRSSTAKHLSRMLKAGPTVVAARQVLAGERLTYLMTALGVPLSRAPYVAASVLQLVVAERRKSRRRESADLTIVPFVRGKAEKFRLLRDSEWQAMLPSFRPAVRGREWQVSGVVKTTPELVLEEVFPPADRFSWSEDNHWAERVWARVLADTP